MLNRWIESKTQAGEPMMFGDMRMIPFAHSVQVKSPGGNAGLIWNRPTTMVVQTPSGAETVVRIPDVTRQAQVALLSGGLLGALLIWLFTRRS